MKWKKLEKNIFSLNEFFSNNKIIDNDVCNFDIQTKGCLLEFETEKGEMCKKFI